MVREIRLRLGVCEWALPVNGPYGCKIAADLGLDGMQLDLGTYDRGFSLSRKSVQQAYLEAANQYGVTFPSIAIPELDNYSMVAPQGSPEGEIAVSAIFKAIEAAAAMEIPVVMIPSFGKSAIKDQETFKQAVYVLRHVCDLGAARGIVIATENPLPVSETMELFEQVDKENLGLYFDSQNYYLQRGLDSARVLSELKQFVCEMHVKDGKDGHLSGALLGEGETGFYRTMEVAREMDYSGWIVLENYYDREPLSLLGDPMELLKKDIWTLKSVFA